MERTNQPIIVKFGKRPKFVLVCCLHGEEKFGRKVFDYFEKNNQMFGNFLLILAHPAALSLGQRFIDSDLNRSFPGLKTGNTEEKIAYKLTRNIPKSAYLIDIHTTVTDIKFLPIVTSISKKTKNLINLCSARNIGLVKSPLKDISLIGQFDRSISLEINRVFAKKRVALELIIDFVNDLIEGKIKPKMCRSIYEVDQVIRKEIKLPKKVENFKKIRGLGLYSILYHTKSYSEIHCLAASKKRRLKI
ncbi:MAG: succinylglutamate desuccinylase/aspartoacylase family protein [Candidatus Berkelbacteria bacterium]|nr:succinylglutamate desuccinylase/aspartoacylase family protein [Candidatus Berkelbacteria bacterium]